jgi:hypothetical protein
MKTEIPKKTVKMFYEMSEVAKTQTVENIIKAARSNDIKITKDDMQKLAYIVNSTIDSVCMNSTQNFENRLTEMVEQEAGSKSS